MSEVRTTTIFGLPDPRFEPDEDGNRPIREIQLFGDITLERLMAEADMMCREIVQAIQEGGFVVGDEDEDDELLGYSHALSMIVTSMALGMGAPPEDGLTTDWAYDAEWRAFSRWRPATREEIEGGFDGPQIHQIVYRESIEVDDQIWASDTENEGKRTGPMMSVDLGLTADVRANLIANPTPGSYQATEAPSG